MSNKRITMPAMRGDAIICEAAFRKMPLIAGVVKAAEAAPKKTVLLAGTLHNLQAP
jgi:hypothetical protein